MQVHIKAGRKAFRFNEANQQRSIFGAGEIDPLPKGKPFRFSEAGRYVESEEELEDTVFPEVSLFPFAQDKPQDDSDGIQELYSRNWADISEEAARDEEEAFEIFEKLVKSRQAIPEKLYDRLPADLKAVIGPYPEDGVSFQEQAMCES